MATIRFKPHYIKAIIKPKIIEMGLSIGHFKTRTTRTKPLRMGEKEIIVGAPPRPLYNQVKTGVIIEVEEVVQKPIRDYTEDEMISDVCYYDVDKFVDLINGLNKARKVGRLNADWVGSLHTFRYVEGGEGIDKTLKQIMDMNVAWARVKQENPDKKFSELCSIYKERQD